MAAFRRFRNSASAFNAMKWAAQEVGRKPTLSWDKSIGETNFPVDCASLKKHKDYVAFPQLDFAEVKSPAFHAVLLSSARLPRLSFVKH